MKKIFTTVLILFLLLSDLTIAQQYFFANYSIEHGLSQSTVYTLLQDKRGYIWAGTDGGGLCRFDGKNFKIFNVKSGLAGNVVRSLMEDSEGRIWIGTNGGVSVYDGHHFRNITDKSGLSGSTVLCFLEDTDHNFWAGTDDGGINRIFLINNDSVAIHSYTEEDGLSGNAIFDIHQDKNKKIWLASLYGGLMTFKLSANAISKEKQKLDITSLRGGNQIPSDLILSIEEDKNGNLWFGTYNTGVFKISGNAEEDQIKSLSKIQNVVQNKIKNSTVWDINVDSNGGLWFGTSDNGTTFFYKENFQIFNMSNGLPNNQILSIIEDKEGNIWLGTNGDGLCCYSGDKFIHFNEKDGLPNNIVMGLDQDTSGNMWLATDGGGIVQLSNKNGKFSRKIFDKKNGLIGDFTSSIAAGNNHNPYIWIGMSNQGISRFDGKQFKNYTENDGLVSNRVNSVYIDKKGIVWCGTAGGVSLYDGTKFLSASMERLIIDEDGVMTIISDKNGDLWFGTAGGLARYSGERSLFIYDEAEGLSDKIVNTLTEGPEGNIWIGTSGGGLFRFNIESNDSIPIILIGDDRTLTSNTINSLVFQDNFTLIVGTDKGFDQVSFNGSYKIINVRNFNASDGFTGLECNDNAICKDKDGNIWFGTVKGATRFSPRSGVKDINPPVIHITGIKLFFKEVDWSEKADSITPWFNLPDGLELSYHDNRLTFYFAGLSYLNPSMVKYKFILEGWDNDWSLPNSENKAEYSGLDHGKYTFKVLSSNASGVWNMKPATFSFEINPPWYKTTLFYIICSLFIILSMYTFIKVREANLKAEKKILEDKVTQRTMQLKKKSEDLAEALKDIKDSINYASRIQEAILPDRVELKKLLPQSFILFKPKDVVSGDFYWMTEVEGRVFITVADCTGHGVPGALMSMICSSLLSQSVNEKRIEKPNEIFFEVRKGIIKALKQKGEIGGRKEGMDASLCIIDTKKNILEFAGANNPAYIIRSHGKPLMNSKKEIIEAGLQENETCLYELKADHQPVGYHTAEQKLFTPSEVLLEKGDMIYLLTDGFQDQFGGKMGKKFMIRRLKQLFIQEYNSPMEKQQQFFTQTITDWKGENEQVDDISLVGIRV